MALLSTEDSSSCPKRCLYYIDAFIRKDTSIIFFLRACTAFMEINVGDRIEISPHFFSFLFFNENDGERRIRDPESSIRIEMHAAGVVPERGHKFSGGKRVGSRGSPRPGRNFQLKGSTVRNGHDKDRGLCRVGSSQSLRSRCPGSCTTDSGSFDSFFLVREGSWKKRTYATC